jgi:hypothetical protein
MGGIINTVKGSATSLLNAIGGGDPRFAGIDAAFGVGRYFGDPGEFRPPNPNAAYDLLTPITTDRTAAANGINNWIASGGGDGPEANFFALHQVATEGGATDGSGATDTGAGTGEATGWREGAGKAVVWFGDAPSHPTSPTDPENTVDQDEAIAALTENDVVVAAINTRGAGSGIDQSGQATAIANATGGSLTNNVSTEGVIDVILDALEEVTSVIDLSLIASGDTSGLDIAFTCTDPLGCTDVAAGESRSFRVDITALLPGTYSFDVLAPGLVDAIERDVITVAGGGGGGGGEVPEPGILALLAGGLFGMAGLRRVRLRG